MYPKKTKKYDNAWLGLIGGFVLTLIGFLAFYLINQEEFPGFSNFIKALTLTDMFPSVLSLSALPNLLLFFIFIWTKRNRSAKGVLTAVMMLAILVAILRFS